MRDGDTVCISGFVGVGTPDELLIAVERRFRKASSPSNLSLVFAAAPGDGKERGLNRLAHPGLVKRAIGGHWGLVPKLGELALGGDIETRPLPSIECNRARNSRDLSLLAWARRLRPSVTAYRAAPR